MNLCMLKADLGVSDLKFISKITLLWTFRYAKSTQPTQEAG